MLERIHAWKDIQWQKFIVLAQGNHALFWLGVCAFLDPIFFPIAPELYMGALLLAHKERAKLYLAIATACSIVGAGVGYFVGGFLFKQFGMPLLQFYHLEHAFHQAQDLLMGHVLVAMVLAAFQPIPEKVFVLAGGFLGVRFFPFIIGFAIGRAIRLSVMTYLLERYGTHIISVINRYLLAFLLVLLALVLYYGIVHFHLLPL